MKLSKKIVSLALASTMTLSTVAFAADLDLKDKATGDITKFEDYIFYDNDKFSDIIFELDKFHIEVDGKYYDAEEVISATSNGATLTEAVKDLTPVGEVTEGELKVESVSAINSTQAAVVFNKEVKESTVIPKNFKVADKDGSILFVSKAELKADKKTVELSFFNKFADKGAYTVEVSNVTDVDGNIIATASESFGYAAAEVAKIEFTATTIPSGKALADYIKVTDKLGRDVTVEQKANLVFTFSNPGIVDSSRLTVNGEESIVTVKVKDTTVSTKSVIKVTDGEATEFVGYAVDASSDLPTTTKAFKEAKDLRAYTTMAGGDNLALYFNDQYGESRGAITTFDRTGQSLTNLTPNVAIVDANTGAITPISSGTAYVKVKLGEVEQTVAIEVRNVGTVTEFTLEKDSVELVTSGATEEIKLNFVDQYGTKMDASSITGVTVKTGDTTIVNAGLSSGKLTLAPLKEGSTTVTVTYKGKDTSDKDIELKQTVSVSVAKAGSLTDYVAEANQTNLDVYDNPSTTTVDESVATIKVYPLDSNGRKLSAKTAGDTELVLLDKEGNEINNDEKVITINDTTDTITAKGTGTAIVGVKVGTYIVDKITFTVVNTTPQIPATVSFSNNAIAKARIGDDITAKLAEILSVKDIKGEDAAYETVEFEYLITNKSNLTISGTAIGSVTDLTKAATADIVVTKITLKDDSNVVLKEVKNLSEVIKLSVDVEAEAASALETAEQAVADAQVAKQEADQAVADAQVAKQEADQAVTDAQVAKQEADQAVTDDDGSDSDALAAKQAAAATAAQELSDAEAAATAAAQELTDAEEAAATAAQELADAEAALAALQA